jgi:hypothetical protein
MTKVAGSGSGSISQRHGSADPDPYQNVMDPKHWFYTLEKALVKKSSVSASCSVCSSSFSSEGVAAAAAEEVKPILLKAEVR